MTAIAAQLLAAAALLSAPELQHFPSSYFDTAGRVALQARAMESWPGPQGLIELWHTDELSVDQRAAILIGGAAHHDPSLLPLYSETLRSPARWLRKAAAYGFHDLIGDRLPDVSGNISDRQGARLAGEVDVIARTLATQTLVEMWLRALLLNEQRSLPGLSGIAPRRPPQDCLQAIDRLMTIDDLDRLVQTYELSNDTATRVALLRLIEGLTLSRFVPRQRSKGWGSDLYGRAMARLGDALAQWRQGSCEVDIDRVLSDNLAAMGVPVDDVRSAGACETWLNVLRGGDPGWWKVSSQQLYRCGGPWKEISVLSAQTAGARQRRDELLRWYQMGVDEPVRRTPQRPTP